MASGLRRAARRTLRAGMSRGRSARCSDRLTASRSSSRASCQYPPGTGLTPLPPTPPGRSWLLPGRGSPEGYLRCWKPGLLEEVRTVWIEHLARDIGALGQAENTTLERALDQMSRAAALGVPGCSAALVVVWREVVGSDGSIRHVVADY